MIDDRIPGSSKLFASRRSRPNVSSVLVSTPESNAIRMSSDLTADDLLALQDAKDFELVDGKLVERETGNISSGIAAYLTGLISIFCRKNHLGWVCGSDGGFIFLRDGKENVRRPDISFFKSGRLPPGRGWAQGYERIAPDLAVEVLSPNDLASEVDVKIEEYQTVGVRLIWVINPISRTVTVFRNNGTVARLHEADQLDGEDVLVGFICSIAEILEVVPAE
jgi:Uma2 family endonuclease